MFEHIVQMGPILVLAGLIAGWVAEAASRAGGYGFIVDMVPGLYRQPGRRRDGLGVDLQ